MVGKVIIFGIEVKPNENQVNETGRDDFYPIQVEIYRNSSEREER